MSRIMWRESRCQPELRSTTRDTGLLQINDINRPWLTQRMNTTVDNITLTNPNFNIAAAAQLYRFWNNHTRNGYQPWETQ